MNFIISYLFLHDHLSNREDLLKDNFILSLSHKLELLPGVPFSPDNPCTVETRADSPYSKDLVKTIPIIFNFYTFSPLSPGVPSLPLRPYLRTKNIFREKIRKTNDFKRTGAPA